MTGSYNNDSGGKKSTSSPHWGQEGANVPAVVIGCTSSRSQQPHSTRCRPPKARQRLRAMWPASPETAPHPCIVKQLLVGCALRARLEGQQGGGTLQLRQVLQHSRQRLEWRGSQLGYGTMHFAR